MIIKSFLVGLPAMLACLAIQTFVAFWCVRQFVDRTQSSNHLLAGIRPLLVAMVVTMLGTLVQVGLWGGLFVVLGEFAELSDAVYHSAVNFAALGYGDIVMSKDWRLLGALEAINGVLMLGMSAAALTVILQKLARLQASGNSQAADDDEA